MPAPAPLVESDWVVSESTYGNRDHETVSGAEDRLGEVVRRVAARGGKVLIPGFALGRIQEIVYSLHQLYLAKKIPQIPVYVDSPLAVDTTTVFRMHPEIFDRREQLLANSDTVFDLRVVAIMFSRRNGASS